MVSQLVSLLVFCAYLGYFVVWVRKHLLYELYKLNNVVRAICLAVMCLNTYAGLIVMVCFEIIFTVLDWKFFWENKINKKTYILDRILMLGGLLSAGLFVDYTGFLIALGIIVGLLFVVKIYYIVLLIKNYVEERKRR